MAKNLVIVESPAKAKTISRYLGSDFEVVASVGHVRDLPAKTMSVDIENDFKPAYEIMPGKKTIIRNLKKLAKDAEVIYLATDPDREGEAISWHILEAITTKTTAKRVIFHEITEQGIEEAFKKPTSLNTDLVDAQQARRVLDRVVGYELSPLLWKKFTSGFKLGLSAGRVQSVALKLIVEREREINSFVPEQYWNLSADLSKSNNGSDAHFTAKMNGSPRYGFEQANDIQKALESASFIVRSINKRISKSKPAAPFTTSTLQQEASRNLRGFSVSRTMRVAQQLYEGVSLGREGESGLITYMRTDSTTLSSTAVTEIKEFILSNHGERFIGSGARTNRRKMAVAAQEAHEAIRPTSIYRTPDSLKRYLSLDQLALYRLIWARTLASRMSEVENEITVVNIEARDIKTGSHWLTCSGSERKFDGYMVLYKPSMDNNQETYKEEHIDGEDENIPEENQEIALPSLVDGDELRLMRVNNDNRFTRPNARYTQATFVKTLEESGIGRPSTYASIMSTLEGRNYCSLENGRYKAEPLGEAIVDQLDPYFPNIMDVQFTAKMENNLDEIANGKRDWVSVLKDFYDPYRKLFLEAESSMPKVTVQKILAESCPECERPLAEKIGRNGKFIACTGFPDCRYSKPYLVSTGVACPRCGGDLVQRRGGKMGRVFYGCSSYPACDFSLRQKPIPEACPECSGLLVMGRGDSISCSSCEFTGLMDDLVAESKPVKT